jgi:DNA-binding CsgD family transcriptional regulator
MLKIDNNNRFILASEQVRDICLKIKIYGINVFSYLKNFNDGSQLHFSSDPLWLKDYYQFELYKSSLFEYNPNYYFSGFLLWPNSYNHSSLVQHSKKYFNTGNGITFMEKKDNYCEFYFFSGDPNSTWLTNFYVNNLEFLKDFTLYFKNRFDKTLQQEEKNKIFLPRTWEPPIPEELQLLVSMHHAVPDLKRILSTNYFENNVLSAREIEIAKQLIVGKSAKEIGKILNISNRTVEKHLENIKEKLCCNTKTKVVSSLLKSNVFI